MSLVVRMFPLASVDSKHIRMITIASARFVIDSKRKHETHAACNYIFTAILSCVT